MNREELCQDWWVASLHPSDDCFRMSTTKILWSPWPSLARCRIRGRQIYLGMTGCQAATCRMTGCGQQKQTQIRVENGFRLSIHHCTCHFHVVKPFLLRSHWGNKLQEMALDRERLGLASCRCSVWRSLRKRTCFYQTCYLQDFQPFKFSLSLAKMVNDWSSCNSSKYWTPNSSLSPP